MREIRVDKRQRKVFCTLSYPRDGLDGSAKAQITDFIRANVPNGYFCSVRFVDDSFTVNSFQRNLADFIKERYPIYSDVSKSDIEVHIGDKTVSAVLSVSPVTKKNMELSNFCQTLAERYADYTSYSVSFSLRVDETSRASIVGEQEKLVHLAINRELLKPERHFNISEQRRIFGKNVTSLPMYISDIRKPMDSCIVCGVVSSKKCRQAKSNPLLYVCSFDLTDATDSVLPCVLFTRLQITDVETIISETGRGEAEARTLSEKRAFANDKLLKEIMWLSDGMSVVAHGKLTYGQNGRLELHVYDLCACRIAPISPDKEFSRAVAEEYVLVKPQECTEYRQIDFVQKSDGISLLTGKTDVVLHVNATSLGNVIDDKLIALCAVKLVDGHTTERFFTYINPEKEVTDEGFLTKCGLSQSKLIFYPTLTEIISDLYKFTYGCRLVGSDLQRIVPLLDYYAAPMNYRFGNETLSQTELLSELLENSTLDLHANASETEDLIKKCKIKCTNYAFCFNSATAVAQCISTLAFNSK